MIVDRSSSHFVFVVPSDHVYRHYNYINHCGMPLSNKEYLKSWGKWLIFGSAGGLAELARKLDPYVEQRLVPAAKYDRQQIREFGLNGCVMCVYCHVEAREAVWSVLAGLGVSGKAWMFERETLQKWLPGGVNLEKWIAGRNLDPEQARRVRQDAEETFRSLFEDEDAVFHGVEQ